MYAILAQLYWPTWLAFRAIGHSYFGMFAGAVLVLGLFSLCWRIEFGSWKFWERLKV